MSELTDQQKRFVDEYLSEPELLPQEAALRAGYSERTVNSQAYQLLKNPKIAKAIDAEMAKRARRTRITQDRVLREVASLAFSNVDDYEVDDYGSVTLKEGADIRAMKAISSVKRTSRTTKEGYTDVTVELKLWDKGKGLEMLSRHLNLFQDDQRAGAGKNTQVAVYDPETMDLVQRVLGKEAEEV